MLYFDDMLIASDRKTRLENIKNRPSSVFKMKDLGEPKIFLGMKITRDREKRTLTITQEECIKRMLQTFNLEDIHANRTLMITRQARRHASRNENAEKDLRKIRVPHHEAIGSLLYLANVSKPDITFAVNYLARKQLSATKRDWDDVIRVFKYINGTSNLGLTFRGKFDHLEADGREFLR